MTLNELLEYNLGIQSKNSNAKNKVDEPENDTPGEELKGDELEQEIDQEQVDKDNRTLQQNIRRAGAMTGQKVSAPQYVRGAEQAQQGKRPTGAALDQMMSMNSQFNKALTDPKTKNIVLRALQTANDQGMDESTLAKKILKKLTSKTPLKKLRKRSKLLQEADPKLFEINFNKKTIAQDGLNAPIKCGFEAETFWFNAENSGASDDVDNMSVSDVEYEFGDLPDSAYTDYNDWIMEKAMDEYLPDYIDNWIEENRDEDEFIDDFMSSDYAPTEEAVEEYRDEFKEQDPTEYENREEDGWDISNWTRDFINEEYEDEYEDFLRDIANEDDQLRDNAVEECEGDYSMDEWISDQFYSMSSFLDDYGYEYSRGGGGVDEVAEIFNGWVRTSQFRSYPESGEYGDTYTTDGWAVETDSSIDPDEGAGAELISPVYDSPKNMLADMKSLFDWNDQEAEFGTNRSTGLHVTMSWQGEGRREPNKLKMALLVGDQYLLKEFDRIRNSYTKSQYNLLIKAAESMKRNEDQGFKDFEKILSTAISRDKFSSINFKGENDSDSGNQLIEFRIGGGEDYDRKIDLITKSVIRYATVMKAGYDDEAFKKDYVSAVFRLIRKGTEIDTTSQAYRDFDAEAINSPIMDVVKNIASKKDYFDILELLNTSLEMFERYKDQSDPDADKKWKQSIKDFKKGTGRDPSWMGEATEEREITGYIEPSSTPPSVEAKSTLYDAQLYFARALVKLAANLATGTARSNINSKGIGLFRKYASDIKLNNDDIDNLVKNEIDYSNISGSDKEIITAVKKGVDAIFKKDIVVTPDFLSQQQAERLIDGLWQFFQTDSAKDNVTLDKLHNLIDDATIGLDINDIRKGIKNFKNVRQKNDFVRKVKGGGYGIDFAIVDPGAMTSKEAVDKLEKFLSNYAGYEHPTSKDHHINIKSDDDYHQVAQYSLVQKLRNRLAHLQDLEKSDEPKAMSIQVDLIKLGKEFVSSLEFPTEDTDKGDTIKLLGIEAEDAKYIRGKLDAYLTDPDDFNFTPFYNDYVIDKLEHLGKFYSYKKRLEQPEEFFKKPAIKKKLQKRFKAFKTFLDAFDEIFTKEGFQDLKPEIAGKDQYDKLNKDFEKNVRSNAIETLNIPSHSFSYISKSFYDKLKSTPDDEMFDTMMRNNRSFDTDLNRDGNVYVIPSAHWSQVEDAINGLDLIDKFEKSKNFFHTWRKQGYKRLISKFTNIYGISFEKLTDPEGEYRSLDGSVKSFLQKNNIEINPEGDSRTGAPGQKDLIDREDLKNPNSGEPINRGSAGMWDQITDDAEQKRFDAFDFSYYPDVVKKYVAQMMKNHTETNGSFQIALDKVLQKIVDREINVDPGDLGRPIDRLANAAGVEGLERDSSNGIASKTNWGNLADYLKIERGVNDQGPNLLKKVYDQFDGDHNWRPEPDPTVCCLPRWAAAVKAADDYIKKNYTVSGGNYFRDGDNVSQMYGGSEPTANDESGFDVTTDDYQDMRNKYPIFSSMMMNGIGNYILQPDVNRLVGFLKNSDNDEEFKDAVLQSMMREKEAGEEPNDFQGALARGRMELQNNESIMKDEDLLEGFPKNSFGMTDYDTVLKFLDQEKVKDLPSIQKQYFLMKQYDVSKQEARDFLKNVEFYKLMPNMKEGEVSNSLDRRRAQKGKDKYHKVVDVPVSRKIAPGQNFDRFEVVKSESGRVGHIVGRIGKSAEDVGSAPIDLADALVDAYNRGGFSDLPIQKLESINSKSMDNILERFEKLPLEKQLEIIRNDSLMESLGDLEYARRKSKQSQSKRYKQDMITIWDSQPWPLSGSWSDMDLKNAGFKRFSKGWKISKDKYKEIVNQQNQKHARQFKVESLQATEVLIKAKKLAESLPNTNKIHTIKDILSKEFPVGDIDIQFKAYLALPIPKMMNDFSKLHSAMGHNADARDIVKHYAKNRMPEEDVKKLQLNENTDKRCPRTKAKQCTCESVIRLTEAEDTIKALCEFEHSEGDVKGLVYLKQKSGEPTEIFGQFTGLKPGLHGFHIHEFGDLSDGCDSAGGHYNPDGIDHGNLENGHVGDLGNVEADKSGVAKFKTVAERVDLRGDRSVVGRALIIHADEDDLGKGGDEESLKTGNAGERLACGVIRLMDTDKEAVAENDEGTAKEIPDLGRGFYKREQMPQLKAKHLLDPNFRNKFDLEIRSGNIGLDKITPSQVDRVPGLSDSAKKFFAKGQVVPPFIIDRNGNLVNGHHRYDAAKMLDVKRVPIIAVNRTIHELVELFGPGSDFNMASQTGTVDARKVKGFKGLKPIDTVDPRSVAAKRGWDTRRQRMNKGQQELDFGDDGDIRKDMEID